jgi:REP element-mobilizing transposase RayT
MARKLRVEYEGAIYHVVIRGVERRRLFDDDADRERFVGRLSKYAEEMEVRLYLFCLMANHVHLLVETPGGNLGHFMHRLQTAYTVYYNMRHGRAGHLFQGRYKAILVDGDEYLLRLSRYIHLNPVKVGKAKQLSLPERIKELRSYAWSSYRSYLGKAKPLEGLDEKPLLAMLGNRKEARREYGRYVELGLVEKDEELAAVKQQGTWGIGSDEFVERVQALYDEKVRVCRQKEDVSFRRERGDRLGSDTVIGVVGDALGLEVGWEQERWSTTITFSSDDNYNYPSF